MSQTMPYKLTGGIISRGRGAERTVIKKGGTVELTQEQVRKINKPGARRKVVPVHEFTPAPQPVRAGKKQEEDTWTADELLEFDVEELKGIAEDAEVSIGDTEDKVELIRLIKGAKK
jgi:hypothetical protein